MFRFGVARSLARGPSNKNRLSSVYFLENATIPRASADDRVSVSVSDRTVWIFGTRLRAGLKLVKPRKSPPLGVTRVWRTVPARVLSRPRTRIRKNDRKRRNGTSATTAPTRTCVYMRCSPSGFLRSGPSRRSRPGRR